MCATQMIVTLHDDAPIPGLMELCGAARHDHFDFERAHEAMKQESRRADHTRVAARLLYDGRSF